MPRTGRILLWTSAIAMAGIACLFVSARHALAAPPMPTPTPLPDTACRGCHGETNNTITFPSGEAIAVDVDLKAVDASPHTPFASEPVRCADCHVEARHYRYPHPANPAQTAREFALSVSANCQQCHFPHRPFHPVEANVPDPERPDLAAGDTAAAASETAAETAVDAAVDAAALPQCVDCHGSHAIAPVEEMASTMPALCLECHQDQTDQWALGFVTPRPGDGAGAEGYAGSTRCNGCHDQTEHTWRDTLHARIVEDVRANPAAVVADFSQEDADLTFTLDAVDYVVGGRWKQIFLDKSEEGAYTILPAQWNVASQEWVPVEPASWQGADWRQECGSCHVTGLETAGWTFTEFGVGCESCHGPAAAHAEDPENVQPFAAVDDQVCGACHSRGVASDGLPFAADYRPGDLLADHFTPVVDETTVWPDGSARLNHQQFMDWTLGNTMQQDPDTSCITCHLVHEAGVQPGQLRMETNALCLECHSEQRALVRHIPFHENAIKRLAIEGKAFLCTDCHMPTTASSAEGFDIHNHTLLQPDPEASILHGGVATMPNACNRCHTDYGEDPEWAQMTIAQAIAQSTPSASAAFGPGPTPTSPPPPTPLPRVGEPPAPPDRVQTGQWLRYTFFALVVLVAAWVVYAVLRSILRRRESHA